MSKITEELLSLKLKGRYLEGIRIVKKYLKKNPKNLDLLFDLAFFYYHAAFLSVGGKKRQKKLQKSAIKIYSDYLSGNKYVINAYQALMIIYKSKRNEQADKRAIAYAEALFYTEKNFITAQDMAIAYEGFDNKKAERYWKMTLSLARGKEQKMVTGANLALFFNRTGYKKRGKNLADKVLADDLIKTSTYDWLRTELEKTKEPRKAL